VFVSISVSVFALVGLGCVAVFFSLLLSIFRSKYSGYPYRYVIILKKTRLILSTPIKISLSHCKGLLSYLPENVCDYL